MCVLCVQEDGRELLSLAREPNYVVDINVEYDATLAFVGLVMASLMLICLCCCITYFSFRVSVQ